MATVIMPIDNQPLEYTLTAPDGSAMKVPRELYEALMEFSKSKRNGEIVAEMKNGGVTGVSMKCKLR